MTATLSLTAAVLNHPLVPLSIPSPAQGVWNIGPVPIRAYALCIIAGIIVAVWMGERRWIARGGQAGDIQDLAVWGIPFGIVGARLYHVATDSGLYFDGPGGRAPIEALYLWRGGLGIWGGVALGALGLILGARHKGIKILPLLDAIVPGVLVAQALGRFGNYFNQELYGRPTDLPWGLEIDAVNYPGGNTSAFPEGTTFHPTFLYESLWCLAAFALLVWADRRFRLGGGRVAALYVMTYTAGRGWIEYLRIDTVELNDVGGLRFNVWVSIILFVAAAFYLVFKGRSGAQREADVYLEGRAPAAAPCEGPNTVH